MKGVVVAAAALMAGPATSPPTPDRPPCVKDAGERRPVQPDKPSDAQRFNPGLF